jgi:hypothetical protein
MEEFLHIFSSWLNNQDIIPPEVLITDKLTERQNKTYLMNMPIDITDCYCVRQYNQKVKSLVGKEACVRYIQILVRNKQHKIALAQIEKVYKFMINRPEFIEDINDDWWVIIDCKAGPNKLNEDAQGNYLYSLSFAVTTKS